MPTCAIKHEIPFLSTSSRFIVPTVIIAHNVNENILYVLRNIRHRVSHNDENYLLLTMIDPETVVDTEPVPTILRFSSELRQQSLFVQQNHVFAGSSCSQKSARPPALHNRFFLHHWIKRSILEL